MFLTILFAILTFTYTFFDYKNHTIHQEYSLGNKTAYASICSLVFTSIFACFLMIISSIIPHGMETNIINVKLKPLNSTNEYIQVKNQNYYFMAESVDGYKKPFLVPIEDSKIKESETNGAYVKVSVTDYKRSFTLFVLPVKSSEIQYTFIIPSLQ